MVEIGISHQSGKHRDLGRNRRIVVESFRSLVTEFMDLFISKEKVMVWI